MSEGTCHDCGCAEGELHNFFPNCDMERCPICKGQLLSCGCDKSKILDSMREPYFDWVFCCKRCGEKMPNLKNVSDAEWEMICGITYAKDCILCKKCMKFIYDKRAELNETLGFGEGGWM
jgi:2-hydroxy-3-keto-5-methylthiopentenyl-1-phosphate phosphatase